MRQGLRRVALGTAAALLLVPLLAEAALTCTVALSCASPNVALFRLYSAAGGNVAMPSGGGSQVVCCGGVTSLGTACSGTFATVLRLSSTTNAHAEQGALANYPQAACLSLPTGTVSVAYQSSCSGYDTTVASVGPSVYAGTDLHVGGPSAYTTKVCASASVPQSLSFSISDNSIGFGPLSSGAARYATGDGTGSLTQVEAHAVSVSTNAASGYVMTVRGATPADTTGHTITAIGGTNAASSPGTEQFGLRAAASGGSGTVSSPYAASGFAYAGTASSASTLASAPTGDGVATAYSVRYLANVSPTTEAGTYATALTFAVTSNF